jgi:hypothetical protein
MENKVTSHVVKGLIISLILIAAGIAIHFAGLSMNKAVSSLQYVILLAGIIWACIVYANQMNNNVTFGNVFAHGFKTTAVVTVIIIIYTIIAIKFIFPEMADMAQEQARENMEKNNMSEDQIEKAMSITEKFFVPLAIGSVLFVFMIIGLISSLIGAAVAKKNPQTPFQA